MRSVVGLALLLGAASGFQAVAPALRPMASAATPICRTAAAPTKFALAREKQPHEIHLPSYSITQARRLWPASERSYSAGPGTPVLLR